MLLALPTVTIFASDDGLPQQTLTVNNETVNRTVSEIRIDANNAVLLFTDGSTMTVDMQQVSLQLSYDETTGASQLHLGDGQGRTMIYDLQGRQKAKEHSLQKGVYIINGKKSIYQKK